ncbi:hypothetical protein IQ266_00380 [filamentous cyanobacterium LEGE 11480]|uniref:HTH luxR-type domain-containing protein n=1 Tax=Romeriopsis navalis LEGE 11480 TaxID=2777977 RepID=A0A928VLU0_9CYAN|nr:helix-turn-helix transcriptional regulator [Romeriopsis navalis]MBE9028209.1 hypothetical protein [Romeriopsis navalis LEGE 11480]
MKSSSLRDQNHLDNAKAHDQFSLLEIVLETLLDAVVIVNSDGEILRANAKAIKLCDRLLVEESKQSDVRYRSEHQLPIVIRSILAALLESQVLFPEQRVLPEFEVYLDDGTPLRIRGQLLDIPRSDTDVPYSLITIENRQESLHSVAIGDAQRFGFTPRETEVWHLRLLGHSYREISTMLFITENTVRKHVKSVLAKRRVELDD